MAYNGVNWVNDGPPAINAANLEIMDNGIVTNDIAITGITKDMSDFLYSESYEAMNLTYSYDGYYNTSGVFIQEASRKYTIITGVSAGDKFKVTTTIRSALIPAIVYFHNNTFLSYEKVGTGTTETLTDYAITLPATCNKFVVQNVDAGNIVVKQLNKIPYYYTKSEIDAVLGKETGKNLFNRNAISNGYLNSTGGLTVYENWKTSDFIKVKDLGSIMSSTRNGPTENGYQYTLNFMCTYDENKNFIQQVGNVTPPYNVASGVAYIRFSFRDTTYYIQVEKGTTITNYELYKEYNIVKNSPYGEGVKEYKDVKWAVFGDSLTEKNAKARLSYYDYVSENLGCNIVNYGKGGTGYGKNSSGTDNFMARMLNINPDAFDVLTIFGSFNDVSAGLDIGNPTDTGTSTLCGCINTTIDNFYSVAPYKVIGLVTPTPWASMPTSSTWGNDYADAIIAIAKRRGIPVMDLFRESGLRPWAGSDYIAEYYTEDGNTDIGAHPNSKAHKIFLYPHFREFFKTLC